MAEKYKTILERLTTLASKWVNRAIAAQSDYEQGVASTPTEVWQRAALSAEQAYNQAMQQVISERRWALGVSNPKKDWREQTLKKAKRRAEGIQVAGASAWQLGFAPFAETLSRLSLPPRGPKMSDVNIQRAVTVMRAMHETKRRARRVAAGMSIGLAPKVPGFY